MVISFDTRKGRLCPSARRDWKKLSSAVVRQIEQLVLRGILRPGERLPAERELAERLGVSRPSLREAIGTLQDDGLLTSKAGAGVFVANVLGSSFGPALIKLFARHDEAVFDYLSFRRDMEGLAAERAARLGSDIDLKVVQAVFEQDGSAISKSFREVGAGRGNNHPWPSSRPAVTVMLRMMRSMYGCPRGVLQCLRSCSSNAPTLREASAGRCPDCPHDVSAQANRSCAQDATSLTNLTETSDRSAAA